MSCGHARPAPPEKNPGGLSQARGAARLVGTNVFSPPTARKDPTVSTLRIPYHTLSPQVYRGMAGVEALLEQSRLGRRLVLLVFLRVSQINACAYCIDKHARDLLKLDEDWQRLNSLSTWRETTFYSDAERAALSWAEAATRLENGAVPDHVFEALTRHFSDQEIADLGFATALMNAWNRIAISFRQPVPRASGPLRTQ